MIYSNEMVDQEGYTSSTYPSAPPFGHYRPSVQPPLPPPLTNSPVIYEMPMDVVDSVPKHHYDPPPKPNVVITQPTTMAFTQPPCKDYIVWSIVSLVFCNIIFGIVATVFSCKTRDSVKSGDSVSAASNSRRAFIFNLTALILGIILHIAWIAVVIHKSVKVSHTYYDYSSTFTGVYNPENFPFNPFNTG